jgi:hypothetical protein
MSSVNMEGILGVMLIALLIGIAILVAYLLTLQNVLKEIGPANRAVQPNNVWLMLIPLFSTIYAFILYQQISESLKREYEERDIIGGGDYGKGLGMASAVIGVVTLLNNIVDLGAIGGLVGLAGLVILIVFWVKMSEFKKRLQKTPNSGGISSNPDILD